MKRNKPVAPTILPGQCVRLFYKTVVSIKITVFIIPQPMKYCRKSNCSPTTKCFWIKLFLLTLIIQIRNTWSLLLVATKFFRFQTSPRVQSAQSYSSAARSLLQLLSKLCDPAPSQVSGRHPGDTGHILSPLTQQPGNLPAYVCAAHKQLRIRAQEALRAMTKPNSWFP